ESMRSDGGSVMRGNDLLCGTADVMVTDTLTGNIMMKVFSSFTTGGSYEASGFGYGPGIGEDYERTILILSRASGVPVVANALSYAKDLAKGKLAEKCSLEFANAKKAGLDEILESLKETKKTETAAEEVKMPEKETVTGQIAGIDIMDLEDAVTALWKENIYAESGMGCTGPIVRVSEARMEAAITALVKAEFLAE
ncbi:Fatty acid synthesis protein, partial [Dethiosulfatibacter aminovorans DSM 17477]